ncbi:MAG: abortive infection system antitoxin AbiGi family protein [Dermatophilaceae bacterium]
MTTIEQLLHRRGDLSTFLAHLTRRTEMKSAFDNLCSIIREGKVEARIAFGPAEHLEEYLAGSAATQKTVCFTETPLEHLWMMVEQIERRAVQFEPYGLAITKTTGRRAGANPVWYTDITPGHDWPMKAMNAAVEQAVVRADCDGHTNPNFLREEPIFKITPWIEQMGQRNNGGRKEFWWEREWRAVGDFAVRPESVVAVCAPEGEHAKLNTALEEIDAASRSANQAVAVLNSGWTSRAVLDPTWGLERMIATLARVPDQDIGPFPTM